MLVSLAHIGYDSVQNTEIKIPVSCISSPSQLAVVAFAQNEGNQGVWQAFPDENPHSGSGSETFTHWYNFGTDFGSESISPDSASYSTVNSRVLNICDANCLCFRNCWAKLS